MKRFSKMLALGMALAFVFGMTVSAAESPVAGSVNKDVTAEAAESIEVEAAAAEMVTAATTGATTKVTSDQIKTALNTTNTYKVNKVVGVWNLTVSAEGQVTFTAPAPAEKQAYVLVHFQDDACTIVKEVLAVTAVGGKYVATVKSGSPFALVLVDDTTTPPNNNQNNNNNNSNNNNSNNQQASQPAAQNNAAPVSPKTGEAVPVMGILAVICLAGVCFCARKAYCSK